MAESKVVVIESDVSHAARWEGILRLLDYEPLVVRHAAELDWPAAEQLDWIAVLVGEAASRGPLRELIARLKSYPTPLPLVCVGEAPDRELRAGLDGLPCLQLELPIRYPQLSGVLRQAEQWRTRSYEVPPLLSAFRPSGQSPAIRAIHRLVEQVAPFETNVLILGESGTGKEMVARHIHELSARTGRPFVPVNCGAIPAELLESELFGHEKGAFTGALSARQGRFEFAEGGTLFLDEIGDMSLHMQVKLLRVLQERTFERVGSNRTLRCDVRIIAATHRDLEAMIAAGAFREDLYYRLNVFPVQMPPLRERLEDLGSLIEHLLSRIEGTHGARIGLSSRTLQILEAYPWPGNVRELANLLERLAILHPGARIEPEHLPARYRGAPTMTAEPALQRLPAHSDTRLAELPDDGLDLKDHLTRIEQQLIRQAMARADGTVADAARLLRMQRTTLVEKLRKFRLAEGDGA